ncbi:MAG: hypothetical protein IKS48_10890 [Eubacterium sp.]|nr:hypothetical protein [Eubacterium sp.]
MKKLKKMAYCFGVAAALSIASFSTFGNNSGSNINTSTLSKVSAASSKKPEGLKYAKRQEDVYNPNAPKSYRDKYYNVSASDFDSTLRKEYNEYRSIYKNYTFRNVKYEAICCGCSRGFTKNGNYYIFTEGFSLVDNPMNGKMGIYVLKASPNEYSYYVDELKKYYKASGQRHKGSVYSYNFYSGGNIAIILQYDRNTQLMYETTYY